MKYIAFSFDDGRSDTYKIALPIMKKYSLTGTVNVISDFVFHPDNYHFDSSPRGMTEDEILKWQEWGGEIATHGRTHNNSADEVLRSIEEFKRIGVDTADIGFASPNSWLTEANIEASGIDKLLLNGTVSYLRSGIQIRREGLAYTGLAFLEKYSHSKWLYWYLNKRNIVSGKHRIYPSVAIKDYTSFAQVQFIINKVRNNEALILMFHSVLPSEDPFYGKDHYFWDADRFDSLCGWLAGQDNIAVLTTRDLILHMESRIQG